MTQQAQQTFITSEVHRRLLTPQLLDAIAGLSVADGCFEELPLITRYSSVDFLRDYFDGEELSRYLLSLAEGLLRDSRIYYRRLLPPPVYGSLFCCLTFVDLEEEWEEVGFCVPQLFFSTLPTVSYLATSERLGLKTQHTFGRIYAPYLEGREQQIYRTRTRQGGVETERIYLLATEELLADGPPHTEQSL
ncbi:Imm15 family immunity protein [Porphyromonas sp.]